MLLHLLNGYTDLTQNYFYVTVIGNPYVGIASELYHIHLYITIHL